MLVGLIFCTLFVAISFFAREQPDNHYAGIRVPDQLEMPRSLRDKLDGDEVLFDAHTRRASASALSAPDTGFEAAREQ
jgi:hypothetical protein